jgi:hypothetical protein
MWDIMTEKEYPDHVIQIITYMYDGTAISIDKGINTSQKMQMVNQEGRQSCPSSPTCGRK